MTMTVQSFEQHSKTTWRNIFGDDLEAVLEALETDDNVDKYFEEGVTDWVQEPAFILIYSKDLGVCDQIGCPHCKTLD